MKELNLSDILKNTSYLEEKKVWFVAIIWRPNVWKSTFLNALIWEKVSIVSHIPQTTRKKVLWIHNDKDSQIIFVDTPWIHKENKIFNEEINKQAISSLRDVDVILYFIDSSREGWEEEKYIKEIISNFNKPVIKIYTKIDLDSKINLPEDWIKISSLDNIWLDNVLDEIKKYLKTGPMQYGEDYYTTQDVKFRISELIREKVFKNTKEELPHSSFIEVADYEDKPEILKLVAYIYVESDSQKFIIIWKWWKLITKIWKEARIELEKIYWKKVFLALRVKVKPKWRKNEKFVKNLLK